ncbi:glycosyltransferase family 2 protein [Auraticoccus cholistanensis]|uniref:glycosyltransferase family 2 protein n=1 Tax=Auraticoccus cholistanensis TaxID=2656650 RepID=UPI0018D258AE
MVVATRDRPAMLRRALRSVLAQEHPGTVEVTVVFDQGEPDPDLVGDLAGLTGPTRTLRTVVNDSRPGLAGARNCGVRHSSGEFVAFCDDDDEWLPGKLVTQLAALAESPASWFCAGGFVVDFNGRVNERLAEPGAVTFEQLLRERNAALHPSTFLMRTERLRQLGEVDELLPGGYGEDYDLLLRAARTAPVLAVPGPLARVYWHSSSFFADRWRTIVEANEYLKAKHPEFAREPAAVAWLDGKTAFALGAVGERRRARRTALTALRARPGQRQAWAALALSTGLVKASWIQKAAQTVGKGV